MVDYLIYTLPKHNSGGRSRAGDVSVVPVKIKLGTLIEKVDFGVSAQSNAK